MSESFNIRKYNRDAWTLLNDKGNRWTVPVGPEVIAQARLGIYRLLLTPTMPVPEDWIGDVSGKRVLCLASGGGQQGPVLAAMGADVTVLDNSPAQLDKDRMVAGRERMVIALEQGDMRDLSRFESETFDLIFHPVSNCFVDGIEAVWQECHRVLRPGGELLAGFVNPVTYIFDLERWDREQQLAVRYHIPYSDLEQLPEEQLKNKMAAGDPLEFGHSLDSQIGGQLRAGFLIRGMYEDQSGGDLLDPYIRTFMATRAVRQSEG